MHIMMNGLYDVISRFPQIIVYGAGNYADIIYPMLKKAGLKDKIYALAVTSLNVGDKEDLDGIPVQPISEISQYRTKDCVVLTAVSKAYEDEIVQILQNLHFDYVIKMTDYIKQEEELIEIFRKQTDVQFAESLAELYAWEMINSIQDMGGERERISSLALQKKAENTDRNTIVFVSGYLNPRSEKIIRALVRKKYKVIVLEYGLCNVLVRSEIMSHQVSFIHCRDVLEVFGRAVQYNPLLYYCEPVWSDSSGPEIMIKHKSLFGKIVFAAYDVLNDGYVQVPDEKKRIERYCMENADGVVWRWFSKEYLEEKKGFAYKGKSIQFLDYCGGYDVSQYGSSDDRLKICLVLGEIHIFLDKERLKNDGIYVEHARIDTILDKIGNRTDCIFHIFAGRCSNGDRDKLNQLEKQYQNFKVFYGVEHRDLIERITEYDYGCLLSTGGKAIPETESVDNEYYGSTFQNGVLNKYFDYLDAGIPVIATAHKKFCDYLDQFGVLVKMDITTLDIEYLKRNKIAYKENVRAAKTELLMDNQIQRLIDFFESL